MTQPLCCHRSSRDSFANHQDAFRIPNIWLRKDKSGEHYFHARCSCGFTFNFSRAREDDPFMPLVRKISGYGEAIKAEVQRLYSSCGSVNRVSKQLKIAREAVNRIVKGVRSHYEPPPEKIASLRKIWAERQGQPFNKTVYGYLQRYDHDWLMANKQPRQRKYYGNGSRVGDDTVLASRIEDAARTLREEGKRVTVLGLSRVLGQRLNLKRLELKPRTTEVLRNKLDAPNKAVERAHDLSLMAETSEN